MSAGVIAFELPSSKSGILIWKNSCINHPTPEPPHEEKKHILYSHYQRTLKGQRATAASVQLAVIHCCEEQRLKIDTRHSAFHAMHAGKSSSLL